jgi:hypothetical protein
MTFLVLLFMPRMRLYLLTYVGICLSVLKATQTYCSHEKPLTVKWARTDSGAGQRMNSPVVEAKVTRLGQISPNR